jgi:hypothetical protein
LRSIAEVFVIPTAPAIRESTKETIANFSICHPALSMTKEKDKRKRDADRCQAADKNHQDTRSTRALSGCVRRNDLRALNILVVGRRFDVIKFDSVIVVGIDFHSPLPSNENGRVFRGRQSFLVHMAPQNGGLP